MRNGNLVVGKSTYFDITRPLIRSLMKSNNLWTDISPQDSTLLADIVEVGSLPSISREDEDVRYAFYISTRHGLRYECSSISKIQVCF